MDADVSERVLTFGQGLPLTSGTIAAALLLVLLAYALLLASGLRIRARLVGRTENRSLRSTLLVGLFLMTTLPMIALALVIVDRSVAAQANLAEARLADTASGIASAIDELLDRHVAGVSTLAARVGAGERIDADTVFEVLKQGHSLYTDFLTMLVADSNANIIVAGRLRDGIVMPVPLAAERIDDREYFQVPMATGEAFVSRVFQGRGLGQDPIVAISAPFAHDGRARFGIVEGSLDLAVFARLRSLYALESTDLVIADDERRIIFSTLATGHSVLSALNPTRPFALDDGDEQRHLLSSATSRRGWSIHLRTPLAPIIHNARSDYIHAWVWVVAAIMISAILATVMARRVTRPLDRLRQAVESTDFDSGGDPVSVNDDAPREVAIVFKHLGEMRQRVSATYQRLQSALAAEGEAYDKLAARESVIEEKSRQLERANAQLRQISRTDTLTGLANRHAFTEVVDLAWRTLARSGGNLAVIMFDIDFFKRYNDRYGHPHGDACLRHVADILRGAAGRALDIVARYGGEEFVVILTDADLGPAVDVAEKVRGAVAAAALEHADSPFGIVTVSAGVACARPADGDRFERVLEQADQALYLAKKTGRNRVMAGDGAGVASSVSS